MASFAKNTWKWPAAHFPNNQLITRHTLYLLLPLMWHALTFIKNFNCHLLPQPKSVLHFPALLEGGGGGGAGVRTRNWTCISRDFSPVTRNPQEYTHTHTQQPQSNGLKIRTGCNPPPSPSTCHLAIFPRCASENLWYASANILHDDTWQLFCFSPQHKWKNPRGVCNFPFSYFPPPLPSHMLDLMNVLPQSSA